MRAEGWNLGPPNVAALQERCNVKALARCGEVLEGSACLEMLSEAQKRFREFPQIRRVEKTHESKIFQDILKRNRSRFEWALVAEFWFSLAETACERSSNDYQRASTMFNHHKQVVNIIYFLCHFSLIVIS